MELLVLSFFCGLSAGIIGKIKGSSFLLWALIGFCLPVIGVLLAVLYRWDRKEPKRRCPECNNVVELYVQVCPRCGRDLEWPEEEPADPPAERLA